MKAIERAAVVRMLIDLIKADKVIDSREMDLYRELKSRFSITRHDEIEAYGLTLGQTIFIIKGMGMAEKAELVDIFDDMTLSDGFCPREEALLMLAIRYSLTDPGIQADVISTRIEDTWFDERQVLYVESRHVKEVNAAITADMRAIAGELRLCGLDFVYLPEVIRHYISTPRELLYDVVSMLSPSLSREAVAGLITKIKLFKTDTFCIEQLHHKLGFQELGNTPPALLLRINQSKVGDQIYTNFLRIYLDSDVLATVRKVTDTFLSYNTGDRIVISNKKDEHGRFLYKGFYRQLFDILLLQKAVMCYPLIDLVKGTISFPEIEVVLKGLHRKEKALYTLFVFESALAASINHGFPARGSINFNAPDSLSELTDFNLRMQILQRRYARIYQAFGGDPASAPDIVSRDIRLPMISGIRRVINKYADKIYDAERFRINRDANGLYAIAADPEIFRFREFSHPDPISVFDTSLFADLAKIH